MANQTTMINFDSTGRIFYGLAMAGMGIPTIYYDEFPYMLIPPGHAGIPGIGLLAYVCGLLLFLSGIAIVFKIKTGIMSFILGTILLLLCCFYHIPYKLIVEGNYRQFVAWENAEKELALAGGAFIIAGYYPGKINGCVYHMRKKLILVGALLFSLSVLCFGIDHMLYAKEVAEYIPSWVPLPVFWTYLAGAGLLGSSLSIIFKIKTPVFAALLGTMTLTWFIILHSPKVIDAHFDDRGGEVTSAFLALAYSGIAFVIAGYSKFSNSTKSAGEI